MRTIIRMKLYPLVGFATLAACFARVDREFSAG